MQLGKYKITRNIVILFLAAIAIIINFYNLAWLPLSPYEQRGSFIVIFSLICVLLNPPKSKTGKIVMAILTAMLVAGALYPVVFQAKLVGQYYYAREAEIYMFVVFIIGLGAVLTRISGGLVLLGMAAVMILYLLFGQYIPGLFRHTPLPMNFIVGILYVDITQGAFGSITDIFVRIISIFMIFAALLLTSGLGEWFTAIATWVAGNSTGGPAKVSIFSSAGFGTISGSPVANVVADGCYTIPMMKRVGYQPMMAATVEALASTGGMIVPPIMGSVAFVMAEILGVPYFRVCLAAIIPAFLWYFSLYWSVHFYALRQGIRKSRPSRAEFMTVIKEKSHLFIAVLALVGALFYFASAEQGAFWATIFLFLLTFLRKGTRLNKEKLVSFLQNYIDMYASLLVLGASIAVFVAAFTGAGAHLKIGTLILGQIENQYIVLLLGAALALVLGLGVSSLATYLAVVMMIGPILGQLGYHVLVIHMFVFYMVVLDPITPPVCLASFAAAKIAGTDLMKTGVYATLKSIPLWIVPFYFAKKGLLFGVGTPLSDIGIGLATLCFGVIVYNIGAEGYFRRILKPLERILTVATGLMIVQPVSDPLSRAFVVIGVLLLAYWWFSAFFSARRAKQESPQLSSPAGSG